MQCFPRHACNRFAALVAAVLLPAVVHAGDAVTVTVLDPTPGDTLVRYELLDFDLVAVPQVGPSWSRLSIDGEGYSDTIGAPELPRFSRGVVIPDAAGVSVTVLSVSYHDVQGVDLVPARGPISRTQDPSQVPYRFGAQYRVDDFYPAELVEMRSPHVMRSVRGVVVDVTPFQYNPVTRTLRVYDSVEVRVQEIGPGTTNVLDAGRPERPDGGFSQMYENHFLNYTNSGSRYNPLDESGDLLIISYASFMATMQPLVDWKNGRGINTTIVDVSTIGNSFNAIKSHIQSVYSSTNLSYVLLVGDIAQIASGYYAYGLSDPSYSLMTSDEYPDVIVGRFSGTTTSHIATQVQRTIEYEGLDHSMGAAPWNAKGMGVASNQGPGHYGEYDDDHMDLIRLQLLGHGFTTVDQIYDPSGSITHVNNGLHDGRRMVNYCGHGSTTSWGTTGFSNTNVNALQNVGLLPFIQSVACVNGEFDYGTCFGEAWLRATHNGEPTGAVGAYMSSINQSWNPPMYAQDESVDLFTADSVWSMGALWYAGSCKMIDLMGSSGVEMFRTWHIFGDPSLRVLGDNCQTPSTYCTVSPNSVGGGAEISYAGSPSIGGGTFQVTVLNAVPGQFGLFFYGPAQISTPFGNGVRCVGAGGIGTFRLNPAGTIGTMGDFSRLLDFDQPPLNSGPGAVSAGDTWNFQFWYRDPAAGGSGFNTSNGLEVTFCQ